MTKETKILAGVLAGVAVGALVAMLFSSDKEEDVKSKVGDWLCDAVGKSKDKFNDLTESARHEVKKAADHAASKVKI